MRIYAVKLDGTGTAALEGPDKEALTLVDTGTGDYEITFKEPFAVPPIVVVTPTIDDAYARVGTITKSAVQILAFNVSAQLAQDGDFYVMIMGSDSEENYE